MTRPILAIAGLAPSGSEATQTSTERANAAPGPSDVFTVDEVDYATPLFALRIGAGASERPCPT